MARVERQIRALYEMCALAMVQGRADLDGAAEVGFDINLPVFTVGKAGELASVHPQTLRQYDRLGLVVPQRTEGGARRYSLRDVERLVQAQELSQEEGVNISGVSRILELQEENRQLRRQIRRMKADQESSVFAADKDGDIVEVPRSEQARQWRHQIRVRSRELPVGRTGGPQSDSKSMILWANYLR
ncbi:MerR family transcriptional regulator [Bifidobacterium aemilianum]|uniref:MerR family transcriptional regulator n=1 Tax=Bifidobacterium aemilianum TaxID=2493120 RepID=A0A366K9K9_9BIFI|nr:helix-turn-helix transcriptional regulator [Bifidobacterium aemilianum]RBP97341.1 MerR family transcriptional regulator [Bifidobacterium aemilianum]